VAGLIGRPFVRGVQELDQVGAELLLALGSSRVTLDGVIGGALAGPDSGCVCDMTDLQLEVDRRQGDYDSSASQPLTVVRPGAARNEPY
jgi:hypothetical protein